MSAPTIHYSLDAEKGLLGCCLLAENDVMPSVRQILSAEHFHIPSHRILWELFCTTRDAGKPLDPVLLQQALMDSGKMDEIGGPSVILELFSFTATSAHWKFYLDILEEKYRIRRIRHLCAVAEASASIEDADPTEIATALENGLIELRRRSTGSKGFEQFAPLIAAVVDDLEAVMENRGHVTRGLSTGFTTLDRTFMGLKGGQLIILAARPAMGKSALGAQIVENIATANGQYDEFNQPRTPAGFVTMEMSGFDIVQRALLGRCRISLQRARDGHLKRDDPATLTHTAGEIVDAPLYLFDTPRVSIQELSSVVRIAVMQHGLKIVVVDYLQLMTSKGKRAAQNRDIEIGEITGGLKALAKELDIVIIALSQVGRKCEERKDKMPSLADLRESGNIEQDADIVMFLMRPNYYDDEASPDEAEIQISKNRGGPVGRFKVQWQGMFTRFFSLESKLFSNNSEQRQQRS